MGLTLKLSILSVGAVQFSTTLGLSALAPRVDTVVIVEAPAASVTANSLGMVNSMLDPILRGLTVLILKVKVENLLI